MTYDLQAMEAIKQLKYTYVRSLDSANQDGLRDCFTEDAHICFKGGVYTVEFTGRDNILEFLATSFHSRAAASHQVHHPVIELVSDTEATGQWSLQDVYHDLNARVIISGASEYVDTYIKGSDRAWRIADSGYTRLFEMTQPMPEQMVCTYHKLSETGKDLGLAPAETD
ncbi:MAG: nuclear transport factor 2 family protein [Pseudomonadota bacterium]